MVHVIAVVNAIAALCAARYQSPLCDRGFRAVSRFHLLVAIQTIRSVRPVGNVHGPVYCEPAVRGDRKIHPGGLLKNVTKAGAPS
jgi:hypothetical protein